MGSISLEDTSVTASCYARALATKQEEVDLVSRENEQLRASFGQVERSLQELSSAQASKDLALGSLQRKLEASENEIRQLTSIRSQLAGKDDAVKKATRQAMRALGVVQDLEGKYRRVAEENASLRAELERQRGLSQRRICRNVTQNERLRHALQLADREITVATLSKLDHKRQAEAALRREGETRASCEAEAELARDEVGRRQQHEMELARALLVARNRTRQLEDDLERHEALSAAKQERLDALDVRLGSIQDRRVRAERALSQVAARLDAELAGRAAADAGLALERRHGVALEAALVEMMKSRDQQLVAKRQLAARLESASAAREAAQAESEKYKARIAHARTVRDHDKHEVDRLARKLARTYQLLRRKRQAREECAIERRAAKLPPVSSKSTATIDVEPAD